MKRSRLEMSELRGDCTAVCYGRDGKEVSAVSSFSHLSGGKTAAVVVTGSSTPSIFGVPKKIRKVGSGQIFTIVRSDAVSLSARARLDCFASGAHMLAHDERAVQQGLDKAVSQFSARVPEGTPVYRCPECHLDGFTEDALHRHYPLHHAMEQTGAHDCPVCDRTASEYRAFAVHLHNEHGPVTEREPAVPAFAAFAWVICRRPSDGKMLFCHEPAAIAGGRPNYWFPAGRVDEGESFVEAGEREALEEAGVKAVVKGVVQFRLEGGVIPRIVLYAEPVDLDDDDDHGGAGLGKKEDKIKEMSERNAGDSAGGGSGSGTELFPPLHPKSVPDFESCGAVWLDVSQLDDLSEKDYRGGGTAELYRAVASGRLAPLPLNTPSFAALEDMVQRLTTDEEWLLDKWLPDVSAVWKLLDKDYPADRLKMDW